MSYLLVLLVFIGVPALYAMVKAKDEQEETPLGEESARPFKETP